MKRLVTNKDIAAENMLVIGEDAHSYGEMKKEDALKLAKSKGLDLVQVSKDGKSVCKLMDYGRYCYEQKRKKQLERKKSKSMELKIIKLRPNIADNDLSRKISKIKEFVEDGDKAEVHMSFKYREALSPENGRAVFEKVKEELKNIAKLDKEGSINGKRFWILSFMKLK